MRLLVLALVCALTEAMDMNNMDMPPMDGMSCPAASSTPISCLSGTAVTGIPSSAPPGVCNCNCVLGSMNNTVATSAASPAACNTTVCSTAFGGVGGDCAAGAVITPTYLSLSAWLQSSAPSVISAGAGAICLTTSFVCTAANSGPNAMCPSAWIGASFVMTEAHVAPDAVAQCTEHYSMEGMQDGVTVTSCSTDRCNIAPASTSAARGSQVGRLTTLLLALALALLPALH